MLKFFLFLIVLWLMGRLIMRVLRSTVISFFRGAAEGRVQPGGRRPVDPPAQAEEAEYEVVESRLRDEE
ncbi:hypothetical protein [Chlorobium sp. N1]|uniref:hypothetical protein n=1 Tax=Chlorobium sp. N1 TaxID=2491138 RepID=UPI00103ACD4C|nr:hypothetical protein [Chlorobium sp. N1]TCD48908.1 hypothetical protein E0L29_03230 [Chlorobium sp. N1]